MIEIIGSLWEYGALVVVLFVAVGAMWKKNSFLEKELLQIAKDYSETITELNSLIKGDKHHD